MHFIALYGNDATKGDFPRFLMRHGLKLGGTQVHFDA